MGELSKAEGTTADTQGRSRSQKRAEGERAQPMPERWSLGHDLGSGPLQGPPVRDHSGANRLTGATTQTEVDDPLESSIHIEDALVHRLHCMQTPPWRGGFPPGEAKRGTDRETQTALDARVELFCGRVLPGDPTHQIPPGRRPGLITRAGSNSAMSRRCISRPGGKEPHGSKSSRLAAGASTTTSEPPICSAQLLRSAAPS